MIIYFIIPARGGSKGIPKKNIKLFANKPLFQWSIEQAQKSKYYANSRIFVSTDDEKIRNLAIDLGAEAPFLRPKEISQDNSIDLEFMKHFIEYLKTNNITIPDMIVHLRPTYPTRKTEIMDDIITKFINNYNNYDSIRTVIESPKIPYKMYNIIDNNLVPLFKTIPIEPEIFEPYNQCRQVLPITFLHNGYLDIIKPSVIENNSMSGEKILPYIMNKDDIDDIDTIEEWNYAESKLLKTFS